MGKKSEKKVLFLASWYPSKENSTLGNFVQKHAELANEIANVDVLYAVDSETVDEITVVDELVNNVRTVIVYYPPIKSNVPFISTVLKKETYLLALRTGYKYLDNTYDVVHLNAVFPAGMFARWIKNNYGTPYVATVHWTGFLSHHKIYESLPFYVKRIYQQIFNNASKVLPVSDHLGKSLQKLDLINDYSVLNNVVKSKYFYPKETMESSGLPNRFLHISTFDDEHKNISGMLSAFSQLQDDFVLHLITEGEEAEVWTALEKYNIPKSKCIVNSKLSVDEIGNAMRAADCLVLFSNYETFSVVLAEAWTSGLPAIYSQCGGLTEINDSKLGVQIKSKDVAGLFKALNSFSKSNYNANNICNYAQKFSEEYIKSELLTIY
jgi:glycosyltransferase involved in cell wall biosynthesis